jgi:hypothetical protein
VLPGGQLTQHRLSNWVIPSACATVNVRQRTRLLQAIDTMAPDRLGLKVKEAWLFDPQTSAACPRTSSDVQLSLKTGIYTDVYSGGQTQMVVKIVVKVIAKLKQRERCTRLGLTRVRIESLSASVSTTAGRFKRTGHTERKSPTARGASTLPSPLGVLVGLRITGVRQLICFQV